MKNFLFGLFSILIIMIVSVVILSILRPEDGKNYSKGIKHGYAEKCNFSYTRDKNLEILNPDYELGLEVGSTKAIKNNCDQEYYEKL